jgi:hypothetical protein
MTLVKKVIIPEDDLEWILEALSEGYTKKQLARQYGVSVYKLNKFIEGK